MGSNPAIPTMDFDSVVRRRRMVRNYEDRPVDEASLERILDNARRAPSAGFSQGQSFVVVTARDLRMKIAEIAGERHYVEAGLDPWISRAPVHVICCTSEKLYRDRYSEQDKLGPGGKQIEWPIPYWHVDAGASMMLLLLATVNEGLAAGFLGMNADGYVALRELLKIPAHVSPIGMVTIGHAALDRKSGSLARGWRPESEVVHREGW